LRNPPPSIYIGNRYYPLTAQHKVIFACNPLSYGGERLHKPILERRDHVITFPELPPCFLYQEILKPIFSASNLSLAETLLEDVCKIFLSASSTLQDYQGNHPHILISARELKMMALLFITYFNKQQQNSIPNQDILNLSKAAAYMVMQNVLAGIGKEANEKMASEFAKSAAELLDPLPTDNTNEFIYTQSHQQPWQMLTDLLQVRQLKQEQDQLKDVHGLNGVIFEGESGLGKSLFVKSVLQQQGFTKISCVASAASAASAAEEVPADNKYFYH
ncbi:unnamed protein product, partial [marine sediment metagenome]